MNNQKQLASESEYQEARELLREMFVDGEISREEYEAFEPNPGPFWKAVLAELYAQ